MKNMKRLFKTLLLVLVLTVTTKVYAASGSLSVSSGSVYVGDSFTAAVNINGAAAWNVHVSASGPVTNCTINQADATADATDANKTFTANCVSTGEGTITLSLSGDVTSASDGNAVPISGSASVTVVKKSEPAPTPTPTPDNGNNNNNNQDNKPEETKSNNAKVKTIVVEGYKLVKVDDNNYTLSVANDIEKINIAATAEDAKATVTGTGEKELKVGENTIELIVQAEDGTQNKITIKVTRNEEKKVTPKKKDDTKKEEDTKKTSSKNDLKITILLIILFVLDIVLAATVILLVIQNNKLRKNRY